jgi:hypothetical protein
MAALPGGGFETTVILNRRLRPPFSFYFMAAWIGVDLDGTLAEYFPAQGNVIGQPIKPMVERVKQWLKRGIEVRIMTARACYPDLIPAVEAWSLEQFGQTLRVTATKDFEMLELWDDRAIQLIPNTGRTVVPYKN